jgi:Terminase large subunit, T4likevirus-type, N-terminal
MLIATDLHRALDPVQLMCDTGLEPDDWQAKLLRERPKRCLMLASRQSGKTEAAIHLGLWTALFEPPALVLIVSPSQRQSQEVFRRLMIAYGKLKDVPGLAQESALRAEISNGSRIVALPGSERTVRGYTGAKMIILDEAARVDDELLAALRPTMATVDGSLIMLTTPAGKRGEFYRAWTEGEGWTKVRVAASMCPRLSEAFLADELRELGPMRYSEEYELAFLEPDESVFPTMMIERAFTNEIRPLWS